MSRRSLATALVVPAVLLFALTACTSIGTGSGVGLGGEPGSGSGSGSGEGSTGAEGDTGCVSGDWSADLQDLADQLLAQMQSTGGPFTSATASGTQELSIDQEGFLGFANDMVFAMTAAIGDGLVMTVTQSHTGSVGADWAWNGDVEGSVMVFDNFNDSEYTITNVVDINGTTSDSMIPPPELSAGNVPITVTCSGDVLTTHPEGSPFTTTWHRQ
jgi:hypothetical protein